MGRRRGDIGITLNAAHDNGCLIRVRCDLCRVMRHYHPTDMATLLGNVPVETIAARTRCETCGKRDYLDVDILSPYAAERAGLVVRRLCRVTMVRKVTWRDETLD